MNELPPKDIWCRKPDSIRLTGLSNGTYTVQAIRKNSVGLWQSTDSPSSVSWTVNTGLRRLLINELLADNISAVPVGDSAPDLIELYNAGGTAFDLSGMGLTDVYAAGIPDFPYRAGVHVHYQESKLRIKDGLPKMKDLPKEMGGSGVSMAPKLTTVGLIPVLPRVR